MSNVLKMELSPKIVIKESGGETAAPISPPDPPQTNKTLIRAQGEKFFFLDQRSWGLGLVEIKVIRFRSVDAQPLRRI